MNEGAAKSFLGLKFWSTYRMISDQVACPLCEVNNKDISPHLWLSFKTSSTNIVKCSILKPSGWEIHQWFPKWKCKWRWRATFSLLHFCWGSSRKIIKSSTCLAANRRFQRKRTHKPQVNQSHLHQLLGFPGIHGIFLPKTLQLRQASAVLEKDHHFAGEKWHFEKPEEAIDLWWIVEDIYEENLQNWRSQRIEHHESPQNPCQSPLVRALQAHAVHTSGGCEHGFNLSRRKNCLPTTINCDSISPFVMILVLAKVANIPRLSSHVHKDIHESMN